jgi:23S rRNA (guanosine2251-2'-O)-methyltransferase
VRALCYDGGRRDRRLRDVLSMATQRGVAVTESTRESLDAMVGGARHQGVVAQVEGESTYGESDLDGCLDAIEGPPFLLILDGVTDPHNLGACLRSAEAAAVDAVIVPQDKAVGLTPAVRKVASGAAERVPFFRVINLARAMRDLKARGIWLYGAESEAKTNLYDTDLTGPAALVLGAEGHGLRRLTRENCDALIRIPIQGGVGSLNVSVAAGVLLFEGRRQRCGGG